MKLELMLQMIKMVPVNEIKNDMDRYGSVVNVLLQKIREKRQALRAVDTTSRFREHIQKKLERKLSPFRYCSPKFAWDSTSVIVWGVRFNVHQIKVCSEGPFKIDNVVSETQFGKVYCVLLTTKSPRSGVKKQQATVFQLNAEYGDNEYYVAGTARSAQMMLKKKAFEIFSKKLGD